MKSLTCVKGHRLTWQKNKRLKYVIVNLEDQSLKESYDKTKNKS